jgi:hypothetical protein
VRKRAAVFAHAGHARVAAIAQPRRAWLQMISIAHDKARPLQPGSIRRGLRRGYFAAVALPN